MKFSIPWTCFHCQIRYYGSREYEHYSAISNKPIVNP